MSLLDFAINGDVKISCRSVGQQSDQAALFIHGMNANQAFWHPNLIQDLSRKRRLLLFDLRGHGYSSLPESDYCVDTLGRDAVSVIEHYGCKAVDLVAHSFGAMVALEVLRLFPDLVRSVVLLDGRIHPLQPQASLGQWKRFKDWKRHFDAAGIEIDSSWEIDFKLPLKVGRESWAMVKESLQEDGFFVPALSGRLAKKYLRLMGETSAPADLKDFASYDQSCLMQSEIPIAAVYGLESPFYPTLAALEKLNPKISTFRVQAGHNFPLTHPAETAQLVRAFWKQQTMELAS